MRVGAVLGLMAVWLPACGGSEVPPPVRLERPGETRPTPAARAVAPGRCEVRDYGPGGSDDYSAVTYRIDAAGRIVEREQTQSEAALTLTTRFELDGDGRVARTRTETYAENGELPPEPSCEATYEVDAAARRVVEHQRYDDDSTFDITWTFDEAGRPVSRTMEGSQQRVSIDERDDGAEGELEPVFSRFGCAYDAAGRLVSELSEAGDVRTYEYEGRGGWPIRVRLSGIDDTSTLTVVPMDGGVRLVEDGGDDMSGRVDYLGDCREVFFGDMCSPIFAPTPPSGQRARLPE